jgi:hypothetical protein
MKIYNNILPHDLNSKIIQILVESPHWQFAEDDEKGILPGVFDNSVNHSAFILSSFDIFKNTNCAPILNIYADVILQFVLKECGIDKYKLQRACWNYYMPGMSGNYHMDNENDNRLSILYSLNTTDGGFYLEDKFFPDIMGQAKVFKSNIKHKGVGPIKDKARFNLNMIIIV